MQARFLYLFTAMISTFFLVAGTQLASAQNSCSAASEQLKKELLKTASGKNQLKGAARKNFNLLADSVNISASATGNDLGCFMELTRLMQPLRDNHLHFSEHIEKLIPVDSLRNENWIRNYRSTRRFIDFPRVNLSADSLERTLASRADSGWEGIYYLENMMKIGIFKMQASDTLMAVVLESYLPQWDKGQVMAWFWQSTAAGMASVYAHYIEKNWNFHRNVRLINKRIPFLGLRRVVNQPDHINLPRNTPTFSFKQLGNGIDYIRLGSFSRDPKNESASGKFYGEIKNSLKGSAILVDLRNNGGGAAKVSRPYYRLLKKQARKKKIYLLMNNSSISEAECLIIQLKDRKNIYTLGETTRGMIAYGNNTGLTKKIGKSFLLYITDMTGTAKEISLEDKGVEPTIKLDISSDWVEQAKRVIGGNKES